MMIAEAIGEDHRQERAWLEVDKTHSQELFMNSRIRNYKIASHRED